MNILLVGVSILAVGVTNSGDNILSADCIYPKHLIPGWQIVDAVPPADYAPGKYIYSAGIFTRIPPNAEVVAAAAARTREAAKVARAAAVEAIIVTTAAGRKFDGDEISQTRMVRAIVALNAQPQTPVPTVIWVLADNTAVQTTAAELIEALSRAGATQAAVWAI